MVSFVGDGGFLMTGQEFATALHHGLAPIVIVVNNGAYGTIRMHQERDYPDRPIATALSNPDFAPSPAPMAAMARPSSARRISRRRWSAR